MILRTIILSLTFLATISGYCQSVLRVRIANPSKEHYKELSLLDSKASPAFAWMDTIQYPRKEVATATLAVTMW
jgi:hypothetical protein